MEHIWGFDSACSKVSLWWIASLCACSIEIVHHCFNALLQNAICLLFSTLFCVWFSTLVNTTAVWFSTLVITTAV